MGPRQARCDGMVNCRLNASSRRVPWVPISELDLVAEFGAGCRTGSSNSGTVIECQCQLNHAQMNPRHPEGLQIPLRAMSRKRSGSLLAGLCRVLEGGKTRGLAADRTFKTSLYTPVQERFQHPTTLLRGGQSAKLLRVTMSSRGGAGG